ncbi:MAG: hypothetical protein IPK25_15040 [Saprospiraceae bacterium]|nr:hypothetical protein [Saprospiraceae bacterium]
MNIENDSIATFQENFGYPAIKGSFQKKDEDSKITTIPMVKNNKITGIFKVYITLGESIRIHFFLKRILRCPWILP